MAKFTVEKEGKCYVVFFRDETGMSILAKSRKREVALRKKQKFSKNFDDGFLLKPEKSAYKKC